MEEKVAKFVRYGEALSACGGVQVEYDTPAFVGCAKRQQTPFEAIQRLPFHESDVVSATGRLGVVNGQSRYVHGKTRGAVGE
jgi:hypothetical protein